MVKNNRLTFKRTALSGAILWVLGSAQAATINVTGGCTLIDAMQSANDDVATGSCTAGAGNDTIQIVSENSGITINTIFEPSSESGDVGLPIVTSAMTIEGNGLTLSADNSVDNFRLLEVASGGDLTLRDTTVTGADDGNGFGSGLLSYGGRVTLDNTTFTQNNGAIALANSYNNEIINSTIRHNIGAYFTGGLFTAFAEVNISNSGFIANKTLFGGITKINAPMAGRGGSGAPFAGGGGSFFQSTVTINNSTFSGNESPYGAGFSIASDSAPSFLPSKAAHFSNSALRGVIQNNVIITNSTISNNQAYYASGIVNMADQGLLTLQGTIVAGNKEAFSYNLAPNIYNNPSSIVILDRNNIIGEKGDPGVQNVTLGASDRTFSNSASDNLYPLTLSNGQFVHPLKVGSLAIDGNAASCFGSVIDQEGKGRGIDGDDNGSFVCDVGSFEHSLPIIANGVPCDLISAIVSANNDGSLNGCQPGNGHDIIMLPENSIQTFDTVMETYYIGAPFGLPGITSGITLEGHGSLIERDATAIDPFDLLLVKKGGQLNLIDTTVTGANGLLGAVTALYSNAKVINSTITANQSIGFVDGGSSNSALINSTISDNIVPSGHIGENLGAGLTSSRSTGFLLSHSTINQNSNGYVGGVAMTYGIQAKASNSTISNNLGSYSGGMFISGEDISLTGLTVTGNAGEEVGGLFVYSGFNQGETTMSHSIVSGNTIAVPVPDSINNPSATNKKQTRGVMSNPPEILAINDGLVLDVFNIIGQNGDSGSAGVTLGSSDQVPTGGTNTVIETTLADNGGGTLTYLPVAGGIAVDGGDVFCGLKEDQRGYIRPWDGIGNGDDKCDVGAVEYGSVASSDLIFKDGFDPVIVLRRR